MVAIFGWIMPEPLATPRRVTGLPATVNWAEAVLGRVSVVGVALAKAWAEASEELRFTARSESLAMIFSVGRGTPMMPVEEGKTSLSRNWNMQAVSLQTRSQAVFPAGPVAQLALPELMRTTRILPLDPLRWARPTSTGAAATRFLVKTAAAVAPSPATARAKSGRPLCLIPAIAVANVKPNGTRISPGARQTGRRGWFMLRWSQAGDRRSWRRCTWGFRRGPWRLRRNGGGVGR